MLESLQSKIQHSGGEPMHFVWGKYFLKSREIPRDFSKQFPQLEPFRNMLTFKAIDKNVLKDKLKLINDKTDFNKVLAPLFNLDKPIDMNAFNLFSKATGLQLAKTSKKTFKVIFCACMRHFIHISFHFSEIIDGTLKGNAQEQILRNLTYIPTFFFNQENKYFDDFLVILQTLYYTFKIKYTTIFAESVNLSVRKLWFKFVTSLVSLSKPEFALHPDQPGKTLTFISEILGNILAKITPWDLEFVNNVTFIFRSFGIAPQFYGECISCNTTYVLNSIALNTTVQPPELYKFGVVCLDIFYQCIKSSKLNEGIFAFQFPQIISFIRWTIKNFPTNMSDSIAVLTDINDPEQLGPFNINQYFSYMDSIHFNDRNFNPEILDILQQIKTIIEQFTDPRPLLSKLVADLGNNSDASFTVQHFQVYILFVAQVIFAFKEQDIAFVFKDSWSALMQPLVFPVQKGAKYDKQLTEACLLIMLRCFMYEDSIRVSIFDQIFEYIRKYGEICLSYFSLFLNSLLITDENSQFGSTLSKSKLIYVIMEISSRRLAYFDFFRLYVDKYAKFAFLNPRVSHFLCDAYMDEKRHDSAFRLIEMGLRLGESAENSVLMIVQGITQNISKLLQTKSNRVLELFTLIGTSIQELPDSVLSKMTTTFDVCSQIAVVFPDQMDIIIQLFVQVEKLSSAAFDALLNPDCKVYFNLLTAMEHNKQDDKLVNLLLSLATADSNMIRNPKALDLVFIRAATSSKENQIIKKINDMCNTSHENVFQLCLANGPEHIMKRLETAKDIETRNSLVSLYMKLCQSRFTASSFYSAIRILRRPTFEHPHIILNIYNQLIKTQKAEKAPQSFFHFNGHGTGIFGPPQVSISEPFTFITSFKVNDIKAVNGYPIISLHPSKGTGVSIRFNDDKLRLVSHDSRKIINVTFNCTFVGGKWYSIMAVFTHKNVQLFVDGKNDSTATPTTQLTMFCDKCEINIATETKSARGSGLPADIGPTFLLKSTDTKQLLLINESVPATLSNIIIASYLPSNATNSSIKKVSAQCNSVEYRGMIESSSRSMMNVLSNKSVAPNFIQLFTRLNGCEQCIGKKPPTYCHNCGALALRDGTQYLINMLEILTQLLKANNLFNEFLLVTKGAQLIAQFISQIKMEYFNVKCIECLLDMFGAIQQPKLAVSYAESIWMNFDFISLMPNDQQITFLTAAHQAFDRNKSAFLNITSVERVLYKYINEENDSALNTLLEQFLQNLISSANSKQLLSVFFSIPYANISVGCTLSILNMVFLLITRNDVTMQTVLKDFSYFQPFVPLMAIPDSNIQIKALQCILRLSSNLNESLEKAMIQCAVAFNKSENDEKLFALLTSTLKENIDVFPFWATVCRYMKEPKKHIQALDLKKFTKVPLWYYWIFAIQPLDANQILPLIKDEDDIYMLFDFFEVYYNETGVDLSGLKKIILKSLMEEKINRKNLKMVFRYLFYTKSQLFTKKLNSLEHYLNNKLKLLSPKSNCKSLFHVNVDKSGKWVDIDVAHDVLNHITNDSSFVVNFQEKYNIHSYVIFAYIAHVICLFEGTNKVPIEKIFKPLLDNADIVTAYTAASILATTWDLPFLQQYLEIYTDDLDSPQLQLYNFEEKISHAENSFTHTLMKRIATSLVSCVPSKEPNDDVSLNAFCSFSNPSVYIPIIETYGRFKEEQARRIIDERTERRRLLNTFSSNLQIGCGPWALATDKIKFIMLNSISRTGIHNLMKIDIATLVQPTKRTYANKFPAKNISIACEIDGEFLFEKNSIIFEGKDKEQTRIPIKADNVAFIFTDRKFPGHPEAIEMFTFDNRSFVYSIPNAATKQSILKQMETTLKNSEKITAPKFDFIVNLLNVNQGKIQKLTSQELFQKLRLMELWQQMKITNFEYIYYLNVLYGKSIHTIDNYPVFPSINGSTPKLDFSDPKFYGVFPRFNQQTGDDILSLLVRVKPYSLLFNKMKNKVVIKSTADIRIGIPEMYCFPVLYLNENHFPNIEDIKLPQWASNYPHYYVSILRRALESEFVSINLNRWIDQAFPDLKFFTKPHQPRGKPMMIQQYQFDATIQSPTLRIRKQIVYCNNNTLIDLRDSKAHATYVVPTEVQGTFLTASRHHRFAIIGTKKAQNITLVSFTPGQPNLKTLNIQRNDSMSQITCATIIGNRYLVTGSTDNAVVVWRINNNNNNITVNPVSKTSFHNDGIVCVAGNSELGILVSVDRHFNVVFETLLSETFIRCVELEVTSMQSKLLMPLVDVFKSGAVTLIQPGESSSRLILFSTRGKVIMEKQIPGKIVETDKLYLNSSCEYLIVGVEKVGLKVIDVATLQTMREMEFKDFTGKFTAIPKSNTLLAEIGGALRTLRF
ncbi:hypothetical protein TRFO_28833 [Tritrichomonas foetus]|uniref:BEACH domain-containing protein n=1 Tax=Tritrichomonas foetus TaxID=1144522 RepID=A0A1J4JYC7_9EUKA|nr:hypothetical protein TRFO_28833 [Tritrichomonas foetus]|eukprot:OHT03698.1 hypothetical protein TRFO_28833 [Tritrichomonas foetus]